MWNFRKNQIFTAFIFCVCISSIVFQACQALPTPSRQNVKNETGRSHYHPGAEKNPGLHGSVQRDIVPRPPSATKRMSSGSIPGRGRTFFLPTWGPGRRNWDNHTIG